MDLEKPCQNPLTSSNWNDHRIWNCFMLKPLSTFAGSHFRWCHFGRERLRHTALKTPKSCTPSLFAKHTLYIRTGHCLRITVSLTRLDWKSMCVLVALQSCGRIRQRRTILTDLGVATGSWNHVQPHVQHILHQVVLQEKQTIGHLSCEGI